MEYIEKKAEEYVSREYPNADFGYYGLQSGRYKAAFMAGYEQCMNDMRGRLSRYRDEYRGAATRQGGLPENKKSKS